MSSQVRSESMTWTWAGERVLLTHSATDIHAVDLPAPEGPNRRMRSRRLLGGWNIDHLHERTTDAAELLALPAAQSLGTVMVGTGMGAFGAGLVGSGQSLPSLVGDGVHEAGVTHPSHPPPASASSR